MSWHPCPRCGAKRKVNILYTPPYWDQPPCSVCGDPGYLEDGDGKRVEESS